MIGQTISHYRITAEIGAGGMGVVYEAEDLDLKRTVALKFLPPDLTRDAAARKRFIVEAQTASAIDHNNVCTIHEVGETDDGRVFIAMARYTGETLRDRIARGPVSVDEALDFAGQISAGLDKAHSQNIVHRDVKPGNIFVTDDGVVKILDFGLARIAGESRMTKTGTTLGTVAYMSPEQAEGKDVDARSDVWSAGAVLYEMLTGRAPFRGDAEPAIVNSILTTEPEPVTTIRREVPVGVEDVVDKALTKDAGKRYQTATELGEALVEQRDLLKAGVKTGGSVAWKRFRRNRRAVAGVSVMAVVALAVIAWVFFVMPRQTIDRIAILPVKIIGGQTMKDTVFVDGMTVELISALGHVGSISVTSWMAVQRYRGTEKTPREIAEELGADALVLAAAIRDGNQVRVSARLIDPASGEQMWAATFERRMSGIRGLYRDVARSVAEQVHATITPDVAVFLGSARDVDPAAYDAWSAGNHLIQEWELERAKDQFEKALAIDSTYAPALSGLADAYCKLSHYWPMPEGYWEKSRELARRAVELEPDYAEGYFVLAHQAYHHDLDVATAQGLIDRGFELNPSSFDGYLVNTWYCFAMGRHEEAIESATRLTDEIAPFNYMSHWSLFNALRHAAGRGLVEPEVVLAEIDRADELLDGFEERRPQWMRLYYAAIGDTENWIREIEKTEPEDPKEDRSDYVLSLASAYHAAGDLEKSNAYYDEWLSLVDTSIVSPDSGAVLPTSVAWMFVDRGRMDDAYRWFNKAYEQHCYMLIYLKVGAENPRDPIPDLDDPRYHELLRKMGFEE